MLRPHCVSAGFLTHGRWQFGKWQLEPEVLRCLGCFYFSFTCTRSLSVSSTTELGPYVLPSPVVSTSPCPGRWLWPGCTLPAARWCTKCFSSSEPASRARPWSCAPAGQCPVLCFSSPVFHGDFKISAPLILLATTLTTASSREPSASPQPLPPEAKLEVCLVGTLTSHLLTHPSCCLWALRTLDPACHTNLPLFTSGASVPGLTSPGGPASRMLGQALLSLPRTPTWTISGSGSQGARKHQHGQSIGCPWHPPPTSAVWPMAAPYHPQGPSAWPSMLHQRHPDSRPSPLRSTLTALSPARSVLTASNSIKTPSTPSLQSLFWTLTPGPASATASWLLCLQCLPTVRTQTDR